MILSIVLAAAVPSSAPAQAPSYPNYDFHLQLNPADALITGTMEVRLPEDDSRPRDAWWFHLPPNRFEEEDTRGVRRRVESFPIGFNFSTLDPFDPMRPEGFSPGGIEILSITDDRGRRLAYTFEENPGIPHGYFTGRALLRVAFEPDSGGRSLKIHFRTRLPQQYVDGWTAHGFVAEKWHPVLLTHRGGEWDRDVFAPAGGRFRVEVRVSRTGWLIAGNAKPTMVFQGQRLLLPVSDVPQRVFPLTFVENMETLASAVVEPELRIFYRGGSEKTARLALQVGRDFYGFLRSIYGLQLPHPVITFVQSDLRSGEMVVIGNTILIPTIFLKNHPILDRIFVAKLARAIAELWFGETVWNNRDSEAWLHLGLTGYLSLDFFRVLYGWDAPIHDVVDWLSPKYREHFFETPVLQQYREEVDEPVVVSLYFHPVRKTAMVNNFQKAPLVIRSLAYLIGPDKFTAGLARFYREQRGRAATALDFQRALEKAAGRSLDDYFRAWFFGTTRMDYALAGWQEEETGQGRRVTVQVERREEGVMPVMVQVTTVTGETVVQKWDGVDERATLEFEVGGAVEKIVLDPEEFLLETNRKNNYSTREVRWRPFYDWSKQKESLVTVVARLGGNAIDGNLIGVGANIRFDDDNDLRLVPIFAENTSKVLFEMTYIRRRVLHPRLTFITFGLNLGGRETLAGGFRFKHDTSEATVINSTYLINLEQVEATSLVASDNSPTQPTDDSPIQPGDDRLIQQAGNTNNLNFRHDQAFRVGQRYTFNWAVELESAGSALGSDFDYTTALVAAGQNFDFHPKNSVRLELLRGYTFGNAPLQKQHLLGDPLVLRGFPRTVNLVSDNIAVLRAEYHYVLTRRIYGETVQTRKVTIIFFADVGKGWSNGQSFSDALTRRDVGFGFILDLNALSMLNFPMRVELAFPIGDPVFKEKQLIFFQALAFF